ncbi:MAG: phospholipase D-like domain-containing protein, partial [Gammaproteobacteria bacterium]|nr:phospholipase D-like domain-containing protein [Gammaproteobacteria bacterium]
MSASARPQPVDTPDAVQSADRPHAPTGASDLGLGRAPQRTSTLSFGLEVTPYDVLAKAMDRSAGAPRIDDNDIRLNFDGPHTFESWIDAIGSARRFVHFENYVVRDDRTGRAFRDILVAKAEQGVEVRVLYDWVGCWATPARYWKPFREKGVQVRAFNRPALRDPFGVLQRDHRKLVCVDGEVAFVGGFCIGDEWAGTEDRAPWRDTGAELRGPAALAAARAFGRLWDEIGDPVPAELLDGVVPEAAGQTHTGVW